MGNPRFLNAREQADCITMVASKGENYDRFVEWCEQQLIPEERRFTAAYFHKWVYKKKAHVHAAKARITEEVKRQSVMQKTSRVSLLQSSVERLQGHIKDVGERFVECEECGNHRYNLDMLVKLEEQLRKTIEAIAKELGELNKPLEDGGDNSDAKGLDAQLTELLRQQLQKPKQLEAPVDAEYRVLPAANQYARVQR